MKTSINAIFIEEKATGARLCTRFCESFPQASVSFYREAERPLLAGSMKTPPARTLFLVRKKGRFIKPFPSHPWHHSFDKGRDYNLITGFNCSAACRYCFTQSYFEDSFPTLFVNVEEMLENLRSFLLENPHARLSTGEFTDSLFLDDITRNTERILEVLGEFPECGLELRTKSDTVEHLPVNCHPGVVAAWSINPEEVIPKVEPGTADFEARLEAARKLHEKGYSIALRVDPMIMTDIYSNAYAELASAIEEKLSWRCVSRVFLGSLRFGDPMLQALSSSEESKRLLDAQYVRCPDGKYRPQKFKRLRAYRDLVSSIRKFAPCIPINLCMEPPYIHNAVLAEEQK